MNSSIRAHVVVSLGAIMQRVVRIVSIAKMLNKIRLAVSKLSNTQLMEVKIIIDHELYLSECAIAEGLEARK